MKKISQLKLFQQTTSFTEVKKELSALLNNKTTKVALRFNLALTTFVFIFIAIFWTKLSPQLPLFYSKPWGQDQLASKSWFLILPSICFLMVLFNLRLASLFLKKEALLAKILIWTTTILILLVSTTIIRVLFIVI